MKASVGAAILLAVLLLLVGVNAYYVTHVTKDLQERLYALPAVPEDGTIDEIKAFSEALEKHTGILKITVNYTLIDKMRELTETLLCYAEAGMAGDYQTTRALLLDAVEDVGRLERLWNNQ